MISIHNAACLVGRALARSTSPVLKHSWAEVRCNTCYMQRMLRQQVKKRLLMNVNRQDFRWL